MKFVTPFAAAVSVFGLVAIYASPCPPPWRHNDQHCYLYYSGEKTFLEAEQFCQETSIPGCRCANLASVRNMEEFIFVRDLAYSIALEPVAFYLGGYTTNKCPSGSWTDQSQDAAVICTGDEFENQNKCDETCDFDKDGTCDVEMCMVSNLETWMASMELNGNFTAMVGNYSCHETQLPFVCKAPIDVVCEQEDIQ